MLSLRRTHDFQKFVTPEQNKPARVNPPSFNWPQSNYQAIYSIELEHVEKQLQWRWENVSSPFRLPFLLSSGQYRWRVQDIDSSTSQWMTFAIDSQTEKYLPPSAKELFELCSEHQQFLMYFDQDIPSVRDFSAQSYQKFKNTAKLVDIDAISYPTHYRRGQEEGKRTAIANVRNWIDRDLMALSLLYKIWGEEESGELAVQLMLRLAEWSPEGPASLLRPCTWGDEVGLSLARNLYLAYHWLAPLLTDSEKDFIRPMLVRIAYQMEQRLEQDQFKQFPGHSHTSRLPAYLGVAALALHKEYDEQMCERWLNYALMIYQSVLPFYGGEDGSWAEGPFYSSSYSKWHHPFFLSVERLSGFSFYDHPFYKNYCQFAMDFVAPEQDIHPFGDGFWCKRDGREWPGFFAQNPLRIYAERFGDEHARATCQQLEAKIDVFHLHLLDVVPTVKQLAFAENKASANTSQVKGIDNEDLNNEETLYSQYYGFAGLGKMQTNELALYYRASQFGNSSHRHADQGNIALFDNGESILTPSGSYGYRFGSGHHSQWTRTTQAHNLPLFGSKDMGKGQILDNEAATAKVLRHEQGIGWSLVQLELALAYEDTHRYTRTLVMVDGKGLLICDQISLHEAQPVQWRLHSPLDVFADGQHVNLAGQRSNYQVSLPSHDQINPQLSFGYDNDTSHDEEVISDASEHMYHLEWALPEQKEHLIVSCCEKQPIDHQLGSNQTLAIFTGADTILIDFKKDSVDIQQTEEKIAVG
ncbi:heparinase II/III family protein [Photobacterium rosenbergii]|uniref:heparinase II/III domain-containing protein n=1 Tax=Photobacterium rosenbergii TaxID=294936 RepID=UPI001C99F26C|nr:heparinase II/III family protein [Photobacterium rosenbergii]MBY5946553.1 heparinase II/III family protein [Photobacterium rosenbergii]